MSPMARLATASGLMMARVRWMVFIRFQFSVASFQFLSFAHSRAQGGNHGVADSGGRIRDANASRLQRFDLLGRRAVAAGDDGSGVPHASSWRRSLSGDESHHWLTHVLTDILGGSFFGVAANFADE